MHDLSSSGDSHTVVIPNSLWIGRKFCKSLQIMSQNHKTFRFWAMGYYTDGNNKVEWRRIRNNSIIEVWPGRPFAIAVYLARNSSKYWNMVFARTLRRLMIYDTVSHIILSCDWIIWFSLIFQSLGLKTNRTETFITAYVYCIRFEGFQIPLKNTHAVYLPKYSPLKCHFGISMSKMWNCGID